MLGYSERVTSGVVSHFKTSQFHNLKLKNTIVLSCFFLCFHHSVTSLIYHVHVISSLFLQSTT